LGKRVGFFGSLDKQLFKFERFMAETQRKVKNFMLYFLALLAWVVPGLGHWILGLRQRAMVIFVAIVSTFVIGLLLGGIEMIDPQNSTAWFCAQILTGIPALISVKVQNPDILAGLGRGVDLGQVYAGVAGLLNLLCILDVLMRCHNISSPGKPKAK
jgi:hypothetical protein